MGCFQFELLQIVVAIYYKKLLQIAFMKWTLLYMSFCKHILALVLGIYLGVGSLGYGVCIWSPLVNIANQVPKWLYQLYLFRIVWEFQSLHILTFSIIFFFLVILVSVVLFHIFLTTKWPCMFISSFLIFMSFIYFLALVHWPGPPVQFE